jgi:hypothetical protein
VCPSLCPSLYPSLSLSRLRVCVWFYLSVLLYHSFCLRRSHPLHLPLVVFPPSLRHLIRFTLFRRSWIVLGEPSASVSLSTNCASKSVQAKFCECRLQTVRQKSTEAHCNLRGHVRSDTRTWLRTPRIIDQHNTQHESAEFPSGGEVVHVHARHACNQS